MDPRNAFGLGRGQQQTEEHIVDDDDEIDFTRSAVQSKMVPINDQPECKYFFLQQIGINKVVQATKFSKDRVNDIYAKVGRALLLEESTYSIEYRLRRKSGKTESITVTYNEDPEILSESCELLYCQAQSNDTLFIHRIKKKEKSPSRKMKKSELLYGPFSKKIGTANLSAYEDLANNKHHISNFLQTLAKVRVLLSDAKCVNLLNVCEFVCPVESCRTKVSLGSFNKLSLVNRHITTHKIKKNKLCETLCERFSFLNTDDWFEKNSSDMSVPEMIQMLEDSQPALSVSGLKLAYLYKGGKFRYSSHHMDEDILSDLLDDDYSKLSQIKNHLTVSKQFALAKSKNRRSEADEQDENEEEGTNEREEAVNISSGDDLSDRERDENEDDDDDAKSNEDDEDEDDDDEDGESSTDKDDDESNEGNDDA